LMFLRTFLQFSWHRVGLPSSDESYGSTTEGKGVSELSNWGHSSSKCCWYFVTSPLRSLVLCQIWGLTVLGRGLPAFLQGFPNRKIQLQYDFLFHERFPYDNSGEFQDKDNLLMVLGGMMFDDHQGMKSLFNVDLGQSSPRVRWDRHVNDRDLTFF
jgi:hypothetical protein